MNNICNNGFCFICEENKVKVFSKGLFIMKSQVRCPCGASGPWSHTGGGIKQWNEMHDNMMIDYLMLD